MLFTTRVHIGSASGGRRVAFSKRDGSFVVYERGLIRAFRVCCCGVADILLETDQPSDAVFWIGMRR